MPGGAPLFWESDSEQQGGRRRALFVSLVTRPAAFSVLPDCSSSSPGLPGRNKRTRAVSAIGRPGQDSQDGDWGGGGD